MLSQITNKNDVSKSLKSDKPTKTKRRKKAHRKLSSINSQKTDIRMLNDIEG